MTEAIRAHPEAPKTRGAAAPRNPYLAVALSACPGLGQHYSGHIVRGILAYVLLIAFSWAAAAAFMFIEGRWSVVLLAVPFAGVAAIALDAWRCARRQDPDYRLKWFNRVWIYTAVTLFLMVTVNPLMDLVVGRHVVRAYFHTSSTMEPTVLKHDLLLVNKLTAPSRGSVVLLDFSEDRPTRLTDVINNQLIRRVIGLPGDTVQMRGRNVQVNGVALNEDYVTYDRHTYSLADTPEFEFGPVEVPEDHYFVLSDNRSRGFDSRVLGFIPDSRLAGTVTKIFWSWNFKSGTVKWSRTAMSL